MSKFKVGDLVTPSKPSGHLTKGEAYAVIGFSAHCFLVIDDGGCKIFCIDDACAHGGTWAHYGQTLAELNVKAGDVVELLTCNDADYIGEICDIDGHGRAVARNGGIFTSKFDELFDRTWRIISRATPQPNWLPCPADYKIQDNHEVTYHMGVPTHYYVTEPVLVDVERAEWIMGNVRSMRGQTKDGKPVGQWTIDMDAD